MWHGVCGLIICAAGAASTVGAIVWMTAVGGDAILALLLIPVSVGAACAVSVLAVPCSGWRVRRADAEYEMEGAG